MLFKAKKEVETVTQRENKPVLSMKIAALRNERNLTQKELAEALNFSKQEISNWETGLKKPRISAMYQLAQYFDVTISELLDEHLDPEHIDRTARILASHLPSDLSEEELKKITEYIDSFKRETV
ncbi:repressor C1 [Paucilactobacillus vaccinostercus DSM 20634]|jgi:transcriptional regulator with XRE-family HTH domain|uniref:Repressor C1 n=1 Tax=Paucilactobacillus vaccinostercus DSM 20634 TaxID=1423813 RepID=A0A0R2ACL7_9LACO|nr:repressor C1 [Paucilactobacillus vaccinostercus DSM 20634]RRG10407.1 MAG: XRE family transcriptional regulator [Lactobacillus sp.]